MNAVEQHAQAAAARACCSTDQEVRQAIDLIAEYVATQYDQDPGGLDWWRAFGEVYEDLSRNFTLAQSEALEIATDTIFVGFGCPRWSDAREGLRLVRRTTLLEAALPSAA